MQQLGFLLFSVLLPIFLQIGAGYALQKRFPAQHRHLKQGTVLHLYSGHHLYQPLRHPSGATQVLN